MTAKGDEHRWMIDTIEAEVASVEVDGTTLITVPLYVLPKGIRHGVMLRVRHEGAQTDRRSVISLEIDEPATARAHRHSASQVRKGERQPNDPGGDVAF